MATWRKVNVKHWERSGIQDEVERGSETNLDLFSDIDPIEEIEEGLKNDSEAAINPVDRKFISCDVYDEDD